MMIDIYTNLQYIFMTVMELLFILQPYIPYASFIYTYICMNDNNIE